MRYGQEKTSASLSCIETERVHPSKTARSLAGCSPSWGCPQTFDRLVAAFEFSLFRAQASATTQRTSASASSAVYGSEGVRSVNRQSMWFRCASSTIAGRLNLL